MKKTAPQTTSGVKHALSIKNKTRLEQILLATLLVMLAIVLYFYWLSTRPQKPQTSSSTKISELAQSETNKKNTENTETSPNPSASASPSASSQPKATASVAQSTPTPSQQSAAPIPFTITAATASVSPTDSWATCGSVNPYEFTANITATNAGTASYYWQRSDGARGPDSTLVFDSAGTKQVSDSWTLYGSGEIGTYQISGWERVVITSPNAITSNNASFTMNYGCL